MTQRRHPDARPEEDKGPRHPGMLRAGIVWRGLVGPKSLELLTFAV